MTTLLPAPLVTLLGHLGQVGVALFALAIGAEFDTAAIGNSSGTVLAIAGGAMAVPISAGLAVAAGLGAAAGVRGGAAGDLFAGVAVSVTAFPVLCKIVERTGLTRRRVGQIAMLSAAIDDLAAWALIAVAVALSHGRGAFGTSGAAGVAVTLATAAALAAVLLGPVRTWMSRWQPADPAVAAGAVVTLGLLAGSVTAVVGLHAIFGGFLAGLCLPRRPSPVMSSGLDGTRTLNEILLLPLFFVTAGLGVDLRSLAGHPGQLLGGLALVLVAVVGKPAGVLPAARLGGCDRRPPPHSPLCSARED